MKTLFVLIATLIPSFAFAATSSFGHTDNSGILVWAFLGMCAMIVVAQVVPAILLMTGMVKGIVSVAREEMVSVKSN